LTESSNETFNYRHKSKDLIQSIHPVIESNTCYHRNTTHIVTIVIHSKFDYETNDIRIGPNIEITINIVNQYAHRIVQDIIKSNRDIVCISRIGKISNNNIFKLDYGQSN
jgi:hypothetical protein